jgi:hypothetical protein
MKQFRWALVALSSIFLTGCATIFEGTTQEVMVVTNPAGASCIFEREGVKIAEIGKTPASTIVRKTKYDITIKCNRPGFQQAEYRNHSGTSAAIAGNVAADLILTLGISSIVDSANGADNKYDSVVNLTLVPAEPTLAPTTSSVQSEQPQNSTAQPVK